MVVNPNRWGSLDSHGFLHEASEGADAGLKVGPLLRLAIPAGLHEVQVGWQAWEGPPWQLRLRWDVRAQLLLCNGYHDLQVRAGYCHCFAMQFLAHLMYKMEYAGPRFQDLVYKTLKDHTIRAVVLGGTAVSKRTIADGVKREHQGNSLRPIM